MGGGEAALVGGVTSSMKGGHSEEQAFFDFQPMNVYRLSLRALI